VTYSSALSRAEFTVVVGQASGDPDLWDQMEVNGASPYFQFDFRLRSIGGPVSNVPRTGLTLQVDPVANDLDYACLKDDLVDVFQELYAGGDAIEQHGVKGTGTVVFTTLSLSGARGTFHAGIGDASDVIDGCFDVPVTPTNVVRDPPPG
jgi:hypothetical protein